MREIRSAPRDARRPGGCGYAVGGEFSLALVVGLEDEIAMSILRRRIAARTQQREAATLTAHRILTRWESETTDRHGGRAGIDRVHVGDRSCDGAPRPEDG